MELTAAVITLSDKASQGLRRDTSGPALVRLLQEQGWNVVRTAILPDEPDLLRSELLCCADDLRISLVLTTGGTGFSPRDRTPEATREVIEREVPGIPEAMRAESMKITPMGCLSRSVCGIRGQTLILNLPGSEKAALENLSAVLPALRHGASMLDAKSADCGVAPARVAAVCISEARGTQKHPVERVHLVPDHGIEGDAHAGNWHRQVSLLARESVQKVEKIISAPLAPGAFAENILTDGICLHTLPVGARLRIGTALCQVTQIGKECHQGCEIRRLTGDCVMPREGIFVKVLTEGFAKAGDLITLYRPDAD